MERSRHPACKPARNLARLSAAITLLLALFAGPLHAADLDLDTIPDSADNCVANHNTQQDDADHDGFGDACDADFDQDGIVGSADFFGALRPCFGSNTPACLSRDLDGDGAVGPSDFFGVFRPALGTAPGPSGALLPPEIVFDGLAHGQFIPTFRFGTRRVTGSVPNLASTDGAVFLDFLPTAPTPALTPPFFEKFLAPDLFLPVLVDAQRFSNGLSSRERIVLVNALPQPHDAFVNDGLAVHLTPRGLDQVETLLERAALPLLDDFEAELLSRNPVVGPRPGIDRVDVRSATLAGLSLELGTGGGGLTVDASAATIRVGYEVQVTFLEDCVGTITMDAANASLGLGFSASASDASKLDVSVTRSPGVDLVGFQNSLSCGPITALILAIFGTPDFEDDVRQAILDLLDDPDGNGPAESPIVAAIEEAFASFELAAELGNDTGLSVIGEFDAFPSGASGLTVELDGLVEDGTPAVAPALLQDSVRPLTFAAHSFGTTTPGNRPFGLGVALRGAQVNQLIRAATEEGLLDFVLQEGDLTVPKGSPSNDSIDEALVRCIAVDLTTACLAGILPVFAAPGVPQGDLEIRIVPTLPPAVPLALGPGSEPLGVEVAQAEIQLATRERRSRILLRIAVDAHMGFDVDVTQEGALVISPGPDPSVELIVLENAFGVENFLIDLGLSSGCGGGVGICFGDVIADLLVSQLEGLIPDLPLPQFDGFDVVPVEPSYSTATGYLTMHADLVAHPEIPRTTTQDDAFGRALAKGDFDADGFEDLLIGIPFDQPDTRHFTESPGAVQVLYGSDRRLLTKRNRLFDQDSSGIADSNDANDRFGSALAVGDFDGDGFDDAAIGSPGERHAGNTNAGQVHVLFGGPGGLTGGGSQFLNQDTPGVLDIAEPGDRFGEALVAGDFDGDGFDDLGIGAPGESAAIVPGQPVVSSHGVVHVLYGSSAGLSTAGDQRLTENTTGIPGTEELLDQWGAALAAGDFNGDGFDELAVGSPFEDVGNKPDAGTVTVVFGSRSGLNIASTQLWNQTTANAGSSGPETSDRFGFAMAASDFDADGDDDLAIGSPGEFFSQGAFEGTVVVLRGTPAGLTVTGRLLRTQAADALPGLGMAEPGDRYASALDWGDFDGDGHLDLAVGIPGELLNPFLPGSLPASTREGGVEVIHGDGNTLTSRRVFLSQETPGVQDRGQGGDEMGLALITGDFNGDGRDDLAVGAPGENGSRSAEAGAVNVLYGASGGLDATGNQFFSQDR